MTRWQFVLGDVIAGTAGRALRKRSGGCRVLMYHSVGGTVPDDVHGLYGIAPSLFEGHMRWLAATRASQIASLQDGIRTGSGIAMTFDDGYRDNLRVAAPLLAELAVPFTVFVTPAFVESGDPRYLSRTEISELAAMPGASIGAHGLTHLRLGDCDDATLANELTRSRAWLEDLIGRPVVTMSYPHGSTNTRVAAAARRAGYDIAACSRFGAFSSGDDPLLVPRLDIWAADAVLRLSAKLTGSWDWMAWRN